LPRTASVRLRDLQPEVTGTPGPRASDDTLDLRAHERATTIERALQRFDGYRRQAAAISTVTLLAPDGSVRDVTLQRERRISY
jgi:hypothetical protein